MWMVLLEVTGLCVGCCVTGGVMLYCTVRRVWRGLPEATLYSIRPKCSTQAPLTLTLTRYLVGCHRKHCAATQKALVARQALTCVSSSA